jgi:hypothetical protein
MGRRGWAKQERSRWAWTVEVMTEKEDGIGQTSFESRKECEKTSRE